MARPEGTPLAAIAEQSLAQARGADAKLGQLPGGNKPAPRRRREGKPEPQTVLSRQGAGVRIRGRGGRDVPATGPRRRDGQRGQHRRHSGSATVDRRRTTSAAHVQQMPHPGDPAWNNYVVDAEICNYCMRCIRPCPTAPSTTGSWSTGPYHRRAAAWASCRSSLAVRRGRADAFDAGPRPCSLRRMKAWAAAARRRWRGVKPQINPFPRANPASAG